MDTKTKKFWAELNQNIVVNKRELLLGITACTLAGIVIDMILSPRKTTTIGSNNGNNPGAPPVLPQEPSTVPREEEAAE